MPSCFKFFLFFFKNLPYKNYTFHPFIYSIYLYMAFVPVINQSLPFFAIPWAHFSNLQQVLEKEILPNYLLQRRWFRSKAKQIVTISTQLLSLPESNSIFTYPLQLLVQYEDGTAENYFLPICILSNLEEEQRYLSTMPNAILCKINEGLVIDALFEADFRKDLFYWIQIGATSKDLLFETGSILKQHLIPADEITSTLLAVEQTNTAIIYNDTYFFKIFRKLETGINPDLEIVRFLSEKTTFKNAPLYGGSIQTYSNDQQTIVVGMLQNKVENCGDAWNTMLGLLDTFYHKLLHKMPNHLPVYTQKERMYFMDTPAFVRESIGRETYQRVTQLAKRTAEMHIALASDQEDPDFAPVLFTAQDQHQLYESQIRLVEEKLSALANKLHTFPESIANEARLLLNLESTIKTRLEQITLSTIHATQTRVHGDYHLGQVLDNGRDFYIIDFEGEPLRPIEERRIKTSPFKDVAGMVRSFHYAAYGELYLHPEKYEIANLDILEQWAACWYYYVQQFFLTAYFDRVEKQSFIPREKTELDLLLKTFILEKAIYEVGYEMNARPNWLPIPLRGALAALG